MDDGTHQSRMGEPDGASKPPSLSLRIWGCRGSIPSPGPATAGYGGHTSCVEIRAGTRRIVFDAGSGLRALGASVLATDPPDRIPVFLTHFHWDHIQGFPFFTPLYVPGIHLDIYGPKQGDVDIERLFSGQMGPIYFPVPFKAVEAEVAFHHVNEAGWEEDGVKVSALRVRHPAHTVSYRIEAAGKVICYVPDNEIQAEHYPLREDWRSRFLAFIEGADVLLHDSMFTDEEYTERVGWGHSTFRDSVDIALEAGVKELLFFHHDPDRSDAELNRFLAHFRSQMREDGCELRVNAAFEGKQIDFKET